MHVSSCWRVSRYSNLKITALPLPSCAATGSFCELPKIITERNCSYPRCNQLRRRLVYTRLRERMQYSMSGSAQMAVLRPMPALGKAWSLVGLHF